MILGELLNLNAISQLDKKLNKISDNFISFPIEKESVLTNRILLLILDQ